MIWITKTVDDLDEDEDEPQTLESTTKQEDEGRRSDQDDRAKRMKFKD